MVSISDIWVSFGGFDLLKGATFMVNQRDRIGLVGRNGAGKSTLLKILYGLQKPTSGIVSGVSNVTMPISKAKRISNCSGQREIIL